MYYLILAQSTNEDNTLLCLHQNVHKLRVAIFHG